MSGVSYFIELKNCAFFARHGVLPEETELGQRFYVDIFMDVTDTGALLSDEIEGTVHYGEVYAVVERAVVGTTRKLIETLANDIALAVCDHSNKIRKVDVTVRKPSAPIAGILDHVQVTVSHEPSR